MARKDLHEANRLTWNAATAAHESHKGGQARFLREGGSTLFPEELALLGPLAGKRLAHLQCNAGADSLSLAARGARVTGVDISDVAVDRARALSRDTGLAATFERADVLDWLQEAPECRFDLAFSSYGAILWLSDLGAWARGLARVLAPGGRFCLVEFHPVLGLFEPGPDGRLQLTHPYGGGVHVQTPGVGDYVAQSGEGLVPWGYEEGVKDFRNPHPDHSFQWGLADVVGALLAAGLTLERFEEYPYANGCRLLPGMREVGPRRYALAEDVPALPLMYALSARR
ncbi:class I SAM-dependent methyltransferase [Aggregicoccus sp. 17bor-14]|uniref:class I SAM-dependent methyltransferase n=1 Tax=Myxococcaceae TaxID=31 RepID=UPI00129D0E67|nr:MULTISPECIES: class I SAM-dependent methyltransferase [Myxococcaceae]MBF5043368.1 class I SAM-dependent methyltransferase [Simulacricoccus sp. 17bor-14]MRI89126.1 class I SAM-dependent methyltransferase [Aggregicoccus sp. 17bor-14]